MGTIRYSDSMDKTQDPECTIKGELNAIFNSKRGQDVKFHDGCFKEKSKEVTSEAMDEVTYEESPDNKVTHHDEMTQESIQGLSNEGAQEATNEPSQETTQESTEETTQELTQQATHEVVTMRCTTGEYCPYPGIMVANCIEKEIDCREQAVDCGEEPVCIEEYESDVLDIAACRLQINLEKEETCLDSLNALIQHQVSLSPVSNELNNELSKNNSSSSCTLNSNEDSVSSISNSLSLKESTSCPSSSSLSFSSSKSSKSSSSCSSTATTNATKSDTSTCNDDIHSREIQKPENLENLKKDATNEKLQKIEESSTKCDIEYAEDAKSYQVRVSNSPQVLKIDDNDEECSPKYDYITKCQTCYKTVEYEDQVKIYKTIMIDKLVSTFKYVIREKEVPITTKKLMKKTVPCTKTILQKETVPDFTYELRRFKVPCEKTVTFVKKVPATKIELKSVKVPYKRVVTKQVPIESHKVVDRMVLVNCTKKVKDYVKVPFKRTIKVPKTVTIDMPVTKYKLVTYMKPYQARVYKPICPPLPRSIHASVNCDVTENSLCLDKDEPDKCERNGVAENKREIKIYERSSDTLKEEVDKSSGRFVALGSF